MPISRSFKFEVKRKINTTLNLLKSFYFWQWQKDSFLANDAGTTKIKFWGNPSNLPLVKSLLGVSNDPKIENAEIKCEVFITDFSLPNSIRIPATLATIVQLNRPVDEILATYSRSLRRSINGQRAKYRCETINDLGQSNRIRG